MTLEERTSTPFSGPTINGIYLPNAQEIRDRAAELRNLREHNGDAIKPSTVVPDVSFQDVESQAREKSRFDSNRRG